MTSRPLCLLRVLQGKVLFGLMLAGWLGIGGAEAATVTISTATTTPLATNTVDSGSSGDIAVVAAGSITLTSGTALTLNSDNSITTNGSLKFNDTANTNGILILPGFTGSVANGGSIVLGDANTDTSIVHPDYADNKRGIILSSGGSLTGTISNSNTITVLGDSSAGIDLQGSLVGDLTNTGGVFVQGDDSVGIRVAAPITGNLTNNVISVIGKNSSGILVLAPISGSVTQSGTVAVTGYDDTMPDAASDPNNDNATQMTQQSGPAIGIGADIGTGILINGPSAADSSITSATVNSTSSSPALMISPKVPGSTVGDISIGLFGTGADAFGLINRGGISTTPAYDTISSEGVVIEGWNDGGTLHHTSIAGGFSNEGTISSQSSNANTTALRIGNLATVPTISNSGTIQTGSIGNSSLTTTAILLGAGADAPTLINSGAITASLNGNAGSAYAIRDLSGNLTTINNTGFIGAAVTAVDDGDPSNGPEVATGSRVALDLAATSNDITITNDLPPNYDPATMPGAAHINGDVWFGSGNDQFLVNAGVVTGDIAFGTGADLLSINGGALVQGGLSDSDGQLTINAPHGILAVTATGPVAITSASFGSKGVFAPTIDASAGTNATLNASGIVSFASGAQIQPIFTGSLIGGLTATIVTSPDIQISGPPSSLLTGSSIPFVYDFDLTKTSAGGLDSLELTLTRKTAVELGIQSKLAVALDPMLRTLPQDSSLFDQFLTVTTQAQFDQAYIQFLPSYTDAMLAMAKRSSQSSEHQIRDRLQDVLLGNRGGGGWASETLFQLSRQASALDRGYDAQGTVLSFGLDDYLRRNVLVGVMVGLDHGSNTENGDNDHAVSVRRWLGGIYAGMRAGKVLFSGSAMGALVDQSVERIVILGNQGRSISGNWGGSKYAADVAASYLAPFGKWYAKPTVGVDYLRVHDDAYTETGSPAATLSVDSRTASALEPYAEIVFGRNFSAVQQIVPYQAGRPFVLSPELRLGFSYDLINDPVDMRARFVGDPSNAWFTIPSDKRDQQTYYAGVGFKFITAYGTIGVEVNGVKGDNTNTFVGRLHASFRF